MKGDSKGRFEAALAVCLELQFSKAVITRTVRNLLNVYGSEGGWLYIEENGYANLVECIMAERNGRRENKIKQYGVKSTPHCGSSKAVPRITEATRELDSMSGRISTQHEMSHTWPHDKDNSEESDRLYQESPDSPDIRSHQRRLWTLQVGLPSLSCFEDLEQVQPPDSDRYVTLSHKQPMVALSESEHLSKARGVKQPIMTISSGERAVNAEHVNPRTEEPKEPDIEAKKIFEKLEMLPPAVKNAKLKVVSQDRVKHVSHKICSNVERLEGATLGRKDFSEEVKGSSQVCLTKKTSIKTMYGSESPGDEKHKLILFNEEKPIDVCSGIEATRNLTTAKDQPIEKALGSMNSLSKEYLKGSPILYKGKRGLRLKGIKVKNGEFNIDAKEAPKPRTCDEKALSSGVGWREGMQDYQVGESHIQRDIEELEKSKGEITAPQLIKAVMNLHGQDGEIPVQKGSAEVQRNAVKLAKNLNGNQSSSMLLENICRPTVITKKGSKTASSAVGFTSPQSTDALSAQREGKFAKGKSDGVTDASGTKPVHQAAFKKKVPKCFGGKLTSNDSDRRKSFCKLSAASAEHNEVLLDTVVSKGLDVGRTTAFKLGGMKGCNSLLQKQKTKKSFGLHDAFDGNMSPKVQWKHDNTVSRAPPLVSPTSGANIVTKVKIPGFGRSIANNDRRPVDLGAYEHEAVAIPFLSCVKSRTEATKVPVPSAASEDDISQPSQVTFSSIHRNFNCGNKILPMSVSPPFEVSSCEAELTPDLPPGFGNCSSFLKIESPLCGDHQRDSSAKLARPDVLPQEGFQRNDFSYNAGEARTFLQEPESLPVFSDQLLISRGQGGINFLPVSRCEQGSTPCATHNSLLVKAKTDFGILELGNEHHSLLGADRGLHKSSIGTSTTEKSHEQFPSHAVPPFVEAGPPRGSKILAVPPGAFAQAAVKEMTLQSQFPLSVQDTSVEHQSSPGVRQMGFHGGEEPNSSYPSELPAGLTSQGLPVRQQPTPPDSLSPGLQSYPSPSILTGPLPPRPPPPWPPIGARGPHVGQHSFSPPLPSGQPASSTTGPYGPPFRPPPHASMNLTQPFPGTRMGQHRLPLGSPPSQMYPPGMEPPSHFSVSSTVTTVFPLPAQVPHSFNTPAGDGIIGPDQKRDAREHSKLVFVGNIPAGLSNTVVLLQEALESYLKPLEFVPATIAKIERVSFYERSTGNYAFVQFSSEGVARIVLDACQEKSASIELLGVQLTVGRNLKAVTAASTSRIRMFRGDHQLDPGKILYVGNLPDHLRNESLTKYFSEALGGIGVDTEFISQIYHLPNCMDVFVEFSSKLLADAMMYKCITDPLFLKNIGENTFTCRHPKFVPLFASAADPPATAGTKPKPESEKPINKDTKSEGLEQWLSRRQTTLYVGNLPSTAEAYSVQHLRELFDGILSRTVDKKTAGGCIKSVTWPPGRHYAHVEFDTEVTANSVMDAYIEQTPDFCLNDMALSVFRHQKYVRPGAIYKTTCYGMTNLVKGQPKNDTKVIDVKSEEGHQFLKLEQSEVEEGDEGSYNDSGQVVHPEELHSVCTTMTRCAGLEDARGSPELGSSSGWNDNLYKTKLCSKFMNGDCPYNVRCRYAHGVEELRHLLPLAETSGVPAPVPPPCQSTSSQSSSTGGTSETASRIMENSEGNDEHVDSKSVICIRGIADGIMTHSLKGAVNELFERALLTAGVLETSKHVVRYSQLKENSKQALVTMISVQAASAILALIKPLKLAGQLLVILPWSHMQQPKPRHAVKLPAVPLDLQRCSSIGDSPEVVNASPVSVKPSAHLPPTWIPSDPWRYQPSPNPECVPHSGVFCPSSGMTTPPILPHHFHPEFVRPTFPRSPGCQQLYGGPGGFRSPAPPSSPWQPSRQQHMQWPAYPHRPEGWPTRPWGEPLAPQSGIIAWQSIHESHRMLGPAPPQLNNIPEDSQGSKGTVKGDENLGAVLVSTGGWLEYDEVNNGQCADTTAENKDVASVLAGVREIPREDESNQLLELSGMCEIHQAEKVMSNVSRCEKEDMDMEMSVSDQEPICSKNIMSSHYINHQQEISEFHRDGKRNRETDILENCELEKVDIDEKTVTDQELISRSYCDPHGIEAGTTARDEKRIREFEKGHESQNADVYQSRKNVRRDLDSRHKEVGRGRSYSQERSTRGLYFDDRISSGERGVSRRSNNDERVFSRERDFRYISKSQPIQPQSPSSRGRGSNPFTDRSYRRNAGALNRERDCRQANEQRSHETASGGDRGSWDREKNHNKRNQEVGSLSKRERYDDRNEHRDHSYSSKRRHGEIITGRGSSADRNGHNVRRSSSLDRDASDYESVHRHKNSRRQEVHIPEKKFHLGTITRREREVKYTDEDSPDYDPMKPSIDWKCRDGSTPIRALKSKWDDEAHDLHCTGSVNEKPEKSDRLSIHNKEGLSSSLDMKSAIGDSDNRPRSRRQK